MLVAASATDGALIATAAFTLLAAIASWATVWFTVRSWTASLLPSLDVAGLSYTDAGDLTLTIRNDGRGTARSVQFAAVIGSEIAQGLLHVTDENSLQPDRAIRLKTHVAAVGARPHVVLTCRDFRGYILHAWNLNGDHTTYTSSRHGSPPLHVRIFRRRFPQTMEIFTHFYPDAIVGQLSDVNFTAERIAQS